jgi:BirA family transcriptional regulator, biotin operon repressor / biotin---[acetyl-CoA-carboxylase] ligase
MGSFLPITAHHLDTVTSTMDAAKEMLKQPLPAGLSYVTARVQTAGRGTQGRAWQSPPGNLYMTCMVALQGLPEARLPTLPLEAGLVLHRLLTSRLSPEKSVDLWLKWPNDLLLHTGTIAAKVAGMLIEVHRGHVLLGLGLNLADGPEIVDGGRPASGLSKLDGAFHPDQRLEIAAAFASSLAESFSPIWSSERRSAIIQAWSLATRWHEPVPLRRHRPLAEAGKGREPDQDLEQAPDQTPVQAITEAKALVMPLRLTDQGHLEVRHADGRLETLVADYLW